MLNIEVVRSALKNVEGYGSCDDVQNSIEILQDFINEVERLLHYNCIKQTPALFKVPKP